MSEPMLCPLTGAYCTENDCPLYHDASLQCEFVMAIKNILGGFTPAKAQAHPLVPTKLKAFPAMKEGSYLSEIVGELTAEPKYREVDIRGEAIPLVELSMTDGAKQAKATLWRDLTGEAEGLRAGDVVTLTNMKIKKPYEGIEQISSTKNTEVK